MVLSQYSGTLQVDYCCITNTTGPIKLTGMTSKIFHIMKTIWTLCTTAFFGVWEKSIWQNWNVHGEIRRENQTFLDWTERKEQSGQLYNRPDPNVPQSLVGLVPISPPSSLFVLPAFFSSMAVFSVSGVCVCGAPLGLDWSWEVYIRVCSHRQKVDLRLGLSVWLCV